MKPTTYSQHLLLIISLVLLVVLSIQLVMAHGDHGHGEECPAAAAARSKGGNALRPELRDSKDHAEMINKMIELSHQMYLAKYGQGNDLEKRVDFDRVMNKPREEL
ncbi:hypothetical protein H4219_004742 [Mycoemilia scoparia]|uniref:Uncharacterized protein n=1 Tax=Mycoemilia scoparia TaxID=417184 RepID=A0A9W7ZVB9_9FUNG|nr:hypothetical protein H4219_004742 [Mycoemilia scoparia]